MKTYMSMYPIIPHFYIVKLGVQGYAHFFFFFFFFFFFIQNIDCGWS